jgi:hypothetical protein
LTCVVSPLARKLPAASVPSALRVELIDGEAYAAADIRRPRRAGAEVIVGVGEQDGRHELGLIDDRQRASRVRLRAVECRRHDRMDIHRQIGAEVRAPDIADADAAGERGQEAVG